MGTVTSLTAARMEAIEAASVVGGTVNGGGHLILTKHDASTIDAGSVIGPTGAPGISAGTLDTALGDHIPIGSSFEYVGTTAPNSKFLLMVGQSVLNADAAYPTFWSRIPASWKSGTTLLMPDARHRVAVAYDASDTQFDVIGETGGAKTVTLSQGEIPSVTIAVDPPSLTVAIDPPSTNISVDPPSTAFSGSTSTGGDHIHNLGGGSAIAVITDGSPDGFPGAGLNATGSGYVKRSLNTGGGLTVATGGSHSHTISGSVDIAAFSATVDIASFNVAVNIPSFDVTMSGGGGAHNNLQPYITMQRIIKVL